MTKDIGNEAQSFSYLKRVEAVISRIYVGDKSIDKDALGSLWNEDMCLLLKTNIGDNPDGLNGNATIDEAFNRLTYLLGTPPQFDKFPLTELKSRIIFTSPDVITAFIFFFKPVSKLTLSQ